MNIYMNNGVEKYHYFKWLLISVIGIILVFYKPILSLLIFGFVVVGHNIIKNDKLSPVTIIGLTCIIVAFNIIPSPFNPTGGELGVEYLRTSFRADFLQLYYESFNQVYPYAIVKVFQEILPILTGSELHERSVLASSLTRIILGAVSCGLIYLIQRKLTASSVNSVAISLATALLYSGHYYVWFYLHGDQFRNAFANLYFLSLVFFLLNYKSNRLLNVVLVLLAAFAVMHSHRAYMFVFLGLVYAVVLYCFLNVILAYASNKYSYINKGKYVEPFTRVALTVLVNVVCISIGLFILKNYTNWGAEVVFSGTPMDISGVSELDFLRRLLLPAEIIQFSTFIFIIVSWMILYKDLFYKDALQSILLIFYIFGFVLSHTWIFSYNIDLSRLFIVFFPFSVLLMVNQLFLLANKSTIANRYSRHILFFTAVMLVIIFLAKLLWETSWNNEMQIPLLYPFFIYNLNELLSYIFSDMGIGNNEGTIFIIATLIFFLFIMAISSFDMLKTRIKPVFIFVIFATMLPGVVLSSIAIVGDRLQVILLADAADNGDIDAQFKLGMLLDRMSHKQNEEAREWYSKAATNGYAEAQYKSGMWLSTAEKNTYRIGKKNDKAAFLWFRKAVDNGFLGAELPLARHYEHGLGTPVDEKKALKYYSLVAERGNGDALLRMGQIYENGFLGVKKDLQKTIYYYEKAIEQGYKNLELNVTKLNKKLERQQIFDKKISALINSGSSSADVYYKIAMLIDERSSNLDEEAKKWYLRAAEKGHAAAQYKMGMWYSTAEKNTYKIGKKNDKAAFLWFRKAVDNGFSRAELPLARHYEHGLGTPVDEKKALKYYLLLAERGHGDALLRLGQIYENGYLGVKKDLQKTIYYYEKAIEQGYKNLEANVAKLNKELERQQILM